MNIIKKIYQHAGKCDDQKDLKDVIDAAMVSTPEEIIDDSPSFPMNQTTVKKTSAMKSLSLFTNISDVKPNTAQRRVGPEKSKRKSTKVGNNLWTN